MLTLEPMRRHRASFPANQVGDLAVRGIIGVSGGSQAPIFWAGHVLTGPNTAIVADNDQNQGGAPATLQGDQGGGPSAAHHGVGNLEGQAGGDQGQGTSSPAAQASSPGRSGPAGRHPRSGRFVAHRAGQQPRHSGPAGRHPRSGTRRPPRRPAARRSGPTGNTQGQGDSSPAAQASSPAFRPAGRHPRSGRSSPARPAAQPWARPGDTQGPGHLVAHRAGQQPRRVGPAGRHPRSRATRRPPRRPAAQALRARRATPKVREHSSPTAQASSPAASGPAGRHPRSGHLVARRAGQQPRRSGPAGRHPR